MKRLSLLAIMVGLLMVLTIGNAIGTTFTMTPYQLQNLYETWEDPYHGGTYLNPNQSIPGGVKYTGNVRTGDPGWGQIQVGANFWGQPYGGPPPGSAPTNVALGMGSLLGYNSYALVFKNVNENAWMFNVYFNVGYPPEPDYYVQNTWTTITKGASAIVKLDFGHAEVWRNGSYLGWVNLGTYPDLNLKHVTNIGFNIGGDMPAGPNDYTFEVEVYPIPEPGTLILLGSGLVGLAGYGKFRLSRRKK